MAIAAFECQLVARTLQQPRHRAEVHTGRGPLDAEQLAECAGVLNARDQAGELTDGYGRAVGAEPPQERPLVADLARDERPRQPDRALAAGLLDLWIRRATQDPPCAIE